MSEELMPLQVHHEWMRLGHKVPRAIAEKAYEEYEYLYGRSQSFDRLHERGGFEVIELMQLLVERCERFERMWRENVEFT